MLENIRDRFKKSRRNRREPTQVQQLVTDLQVESKLDEVYILLIVGSCAIATFGLLSNSAAVIIGAMIVAPLMLPIRGLALGALIGNLSLFRQGAISVFAGTVLAMLISCLIGILVPLPSYGSEVLARSEPTLLDLGVAVAAGAISGYAKVEPRIAGSLAGTAIAVALMPPVCVIGLGLAATDWSLSLGATLLYATNLLGITLSCMLTFLIAGYTRLRHAQRALTWATVLTVLLLIPLGASFARLVRQAQLQHGLEQALLNRTVTFQRLELLRTEVNWLSSPPTVRLNVRAREPVTPKQVQLLEEFISREMRQPFRLIFQVGQVQEVRSSNDSN
ncbi:TIGR00341 family protein [Leptolyngbya sp. AN03gr2]|uniref:TIGR00341 family protein n=1 Tax=unclassified Leptolyngbya TaxID=2650499 RepID=UPI003D31F026